VSNRASRFPSGRDGRAASGGTISTSFTYDPNGNQTSGLGRSISYTSCNKPSSITQGTGALFFSHDVDHQRFKQVSPEGTTLYFDGFGVAQTLHLLSPSMVRTARQHGSSPCRGAGERLEAVLSAPALGGSSAVEGTTVMRRHDSHCRS